MKSVTIKDSKGKKLIKVYHRNGEYFVEKLNNVCDIDVYITDNDNKRIRIPLIAKHHILRKNYCSTQDVDKR